MPHSTLHKVRAVASDDAPDVWRASTVLYSLLIATQLCLFGSTLLRFRRLAFEQRYKRRRYIIFLLVILCLSATRFALFLREDRPSSSPKHWRDSKTVSIRSHWEYAVSFGCTALISLVGDAFLVWRTIVIWNHSRITKWIPVVLYFSYLGVCISSTILKTHTLKALIDETEAYMSKGVDVNSHSAHHHLATIDHTQKVFQILRVLDFSMSVSVSVLTTTMITIRLVRLEKRLKRVAAQSAVFQSSLPYRHVLTLLLESALPFTMVGVAGAILSWFTAPGNPSSKQALKLFPIMMVLWTNALALGPHFIVFRIISGTAWMSKPHSRPISHAILFADDPLVSILTLYSGENCEEERQHEKDALCLG